MVEVRKNRYLVVRSDTQETSDITGVNPRLAALRGANQLASLADSEDAAQDQSCNLRIHEHGSDTVHVYEAWAWEEDPPDPSDWMGEEITEADVAKKRIEHLQR